MSIMYRFAVILIIFEGIIIRSEGKPNETESSTKEANEGPLLQDIKEYIFLKTNFDIYRKGLRKGTLHPSATAINKLMKNHKVYINTNSYAARTQEYHDAIDDELSFQFKNYTALETFFKKFTNHLIEPKVEIFYTQAERSLDMRRKVNQDIIAKYANKIVNLNMLCLHNLDHGIWEELGNNISFPEMKAFYFKGNNTRKEFKVDLLFPKLEAFKLKGSIKDKNCLANVKTLKALELYTQSIQERQLHSIFVNNPNMTELYIQTAKSTETIESISRILTKLKTLLVIRPGRDFLFQKDDRELYNLSSVINFYIGFDSMDSLIGNFSFRMPQLKTILLYGTSGDSLQIIDVIRQFEESELDDIQVDLGTSHSLDFINLFNNIKEITVNNFDKTRLTSLRKVLINLDKESKLQTIKLLKCDKADYQNYENRMIEINDELKNLGQPTWTLSQIKREKTKEKILVCKRE